MSTLYHIIAYAHVYVCESINCDRRKNSQFAINRYSQLKPILRYFSPRYSHRRLVVCEFIFLYTWNNYTQFTWSTGTSIISISWRTSNWYVNPITISAPTNTVYYYVSSQPLACSLTRWLTLKGSLIHWGWWGNPTSSRSVRVRGPPWLGGASGGARPRPKWSPSARRGSRRWVSGRDPHRACDEGNRISMSKEWEA